MDVRLLSPDDIPQAKALWKEAFGDSDEFIEWYFKNKVLPGNSPGLFDGDLISVLHLIPFTVSVQKRPLPSMFIAGAATLKKRQKEGHMRTLLLETLRLLRSRGIMMTHLYPFSHSFYENFGWATYSFVHNRISEIAKRAEEFDIREDADIDVFSCLYRDMIAGYDGYIIRGKREWEWRLGELKSDGGKAAVIFDGGVPAAYMLFFCEDEKINVIETVYSSDIYIDALLSYIHNKWAGKIEYFIPAGGAESAVPFGMARIVDAENLFKFFGEEGMLDDLRIRDDFAEWNNVGFGKEISIEKAAAMVHGAAEKEGWCKLNGNGGFIKQRTCIFEEY